jgi:hypothetical protein
MAFGTIRADVIQGTATSINLATAGQYNFSGNILPDVDNSRNLGSPSLRFANLYVANVDFVTSSFSGDILPDADNVWDIGSPSLRFANIYTGDLHLANDRGDWTVVEEAEYLSLKNNKTGKTFRLLMEEVEG